MENPGARTLSKAQAPVEIHVEVHSNKESANLGLLVILETQQGWHPPVCQGILGMDTHPTSSEHVYCEDEERGEGTRAEEKRGCILLGSGGHALKSRDIKLGAMCTNKPFWRNKENLCLESSPCNKSLIHSACLSPVPELGLLT